MSNSSALSSSRFGLSPQFWRLLKRAILFLAIFHLVFQLAWWLPMQWGREDRERDVMVYYEATKSLHEGKSPYSPPSLLSLVGIPSKFYYPPPFLLITKPLAGLSYLWFCRLWQLLLLVAFWVYAASLAYLVQGKLRWREVLVAGLVLEMAPGAIIAMGLENFEPVMWACYGVAIASMGRSTIIPAASLTFGVLMKLHPLWALGVYLYDRLTRHADKRGLVTAALVLLVGAVGGWWLCGTTYSLQWWPCSSPVVSQGTWTSSNLSFSFAGLRLAHWFGLLDTHSALPTWARAYLSFCAVAAPLTAIWLTRRLSNLRLRLSLIAASTVLFAPLCWMVYWPVLLLIPATVLGEKRAQTVGVAGGVVDSPSLASA